jgi:ADP-ribosylglycohydrolase
MLGAIAGDIIGSVYENRPIKTTDFPLFQPGSVFTDDTVLTVAVAHAILRNLDYASALRQIGRHYPSCGYGAGFSRWLFTPDQGPYHSWGNGAAMRVSPVGYAFADLDTVLAEAEKSAAITHNHPEGIKGAQAVAAAVFLARQQCSKAEIRTFLSNTFGYDLSATLDEIRPHYRFDVSCQGSVPQALIAFLESEHLEDAIRKAVSLGGDSDTLACIAGAVAEAFYRRIPAFIEKNVICRLDARLLQITTEFREKFPVARNPQGTADSFPDRRK